MEEIELTHLLFWFLNCLRLGCIVSKLCLYKKDPRTKLELQKLKWSAQNPLTSWQKFQSFPSLSSTAFSVSYWHPSSFGHQRPQFHQLGSTHRVIYRVYSSVRWDTWKHGADRDFSQRAEPSHLSFIQDSSLHTGRLSNLQVAHHIKWSENNTCEIQLICSVENPNDNVSFRWQVAGNPYHNEANISISWDPKSLSEETYTCIAENPVSYLSSSVSDKSVCEGKSVSGLSEGLECCGVWGVTHALYDSLNRGPMGDSWVMLGEDRHPLELCVSYSSRMFSFSLPLHQPFL